MGYEMMGFFGGSEDGKEHRKSFFLQNKISQIATISLYVTVFTSPEVGQGLPGGHSCSTRH